MDGYGRILTSMFAQYSSMSTGNRWDGISAHGTDESKIACGVVWFFGSFAMDGSRCARCKIQLATSLESTE
jgi:hypothetical protein